MKIKNLTVALLVITVILTKNLAFGCCPKLAYDTNLCCPRNCVLFWNCIPARHCRAGRALDPMQDQDGGFSNIDIPFDSSKLRKLIRKLSPLCAPGIQSALNFLRFHFIF